MSVESPISSEQATEQVLGRFRRNARVLVIPALVFIVLCGAVTYAISRVSGVTQTTVLWVSASLIGFFVVLLPFLFWLNRRYTITTRRLIIRYGFFVRTRHELLHSRGYDVIVTRTWAQTLFRSGNILINSGLDHPTVLKDVPRVELVRTALTDLMESGQNIVSVRRQQSESVPGEETSGQGDTTRVWGAR